MSNEDWKEVAAALLEQNKALVAIIESDPLREEFNRVVPFWMESEVHFASSTMSGGVRRENGTVYIVGLTFKVLVKR